MKPGSVARRVPRSPATGTGQSDNATDPHPFDRSAGPTPRRQEDHAAPGEQRVNSASPTPATNFDASEMGLASGFDGMATSR